MPMQDIDLTPRELETFYTGYFHYYTTLAAEYQQLFITRALQFIADKVIGGAEEFKPDNRVKAMIAASAVQLTLGLETWKLDYFEAIELYPSEFDSATGKVKFKGETNLQGHIKLSWKSFIHGYQIEDDNINLGLHEFTHALRFNSIKGNDQDYFVDHYFNKWLACAYDIFYDLRNKKDTVFRSYGGANINEFLSVCVEHYFESPQEIREKHPLLFYATGALLNQEPGPDVTRVGIRKAFMEAQKQYLPGFTRQSMQSHFIKHWTFRLWLFLAALLAYNISTSGISGPLTLGLFLMFAAVYLWYDYNAVKMEFDKAEIHLEKGFKLFRKRKTRSLAVSQLISLRAGEKEWSFVYYDVQDTFFYEEKISPPKGVNEVFIKSCRENKVAVLN